MKAQHIPARLSLARFGGLIEGLPTLPSDAILDLGCGECRCYPLLSLVYPSAVIFGVDYDADGLRRAPRAVRRLCADIRALPFAETAGRFGLVLIRHPDVDRMAGAWSEVLGQVPDLLSAGGVLLVTCYGLPEADRLRGWLADLLLDTLPLPKTLAAPDLSGQDRYAFAFRKPIRTASAV